jgi:hypothetical protein
MASQKKKHKSASKWNHILAKFCPLASKQADCFLFILPVALPILDTWQKIYFLAG